MRAGENQDRLKLLFIDIGLARPVDAFLSFGPNPDVIRTPCLEGLFTQQAEQVLLLLLRA